jgi:hypothetical protein
MANEVSQADTRFGANPSLTVVDTSDITNDIATAMIAGTSTGAERIWGRDADRSQQSGLQAPPLQRGEEEPFLLQVEGMEGSAYGTPLLSFSPSLR